MNQLNVKYVQWWKNRVFQFGDFRVLPIPHTNFYDVFQGEGWKNWSRVLVKSDFVRVIDGLKIQPKLLYRLFDGYQ